MRYVFRGLSGWGFGWGTDSNLKKRILHKRVTV